MRKKEQEHLIQTVYPGSIAEEVVLLQEAAKAKIDRTKEYRDAIDRVGKQLKVELLVANYAKKNPVSDKEVRAAYDNAKKVYGDTEYQVRHNLNRLIRSRALPAA